MTPMMYLSFKCMGKRSGGFLTHRPYCRWNTSLLFDVRRELARDRFDLKITRTSLANIHVDCKMNLSLSQGTYFISPEGIGTKQNQCRVTFHAISPLACCRLRMLIC